MDLEQLQQEEHDVEFFSTSLEKYESQYYFAENCPESMNVAAILVDTKELKDMLKPSTMRCLEVCWRILPTLAKEKLDILIEFAQDANSRLEMQPSNTKEYVENIAFINSVQEEMVTRDEDALVVKQLYNLIQKYKVPVKDEDLATFMTLEPGISGLKISIDKNVSVLETKKNEFRACLDKDLIELSMLYVVSRLNPLLLGFK